MHKRDQITVAGMRFHALVGVLARERELLQLLGADISVGVTSAMRGDA